MPTSVPEGVAVTRIRPWPDPVIDTIGHDPRSLYVETFWLPTLGPTALLLLRHIAQRFERLAAADVDGESGEVGEAHEVELEATETALALGLGPRRGANTPLVRTLTRLSQFDMAFPHPDGSVAVRRTLPPIGERHARRLPTPLRAEHDRWTRRSGGPRDLAERRAKRVAYTLVELGEEVDVVERTLDAMGFLPHLCRAAATWAQACHRAAEQSGDGCPTSRPAA